MDNLSFSNNSFRLALLMGKTCVGIEMSQRHQESAEGERKNMI